MVIAPSQTGMLEKIALAVETKLSKRMNILPFEQLQQAVRENPRRPHDLGAMLRRPGLNVIAEIKFQSPSQGNFSSTQSPVEIAAQYLDAGAGALSILTEEDYFKGNLTYLKDVRRAFPKAILLQKDFILDIYQIFEALHYGADTILIIMALVGEKKAAHLLASARALSLSSIVEVHDASELDMARRIGAPIVGINNRNLKDLSISLNVTERLRPLCPPEALVICESGLENHSQLCALKALGCHGFLVGSSLMRDGRPGPALRRLLGEESP